MPESEGIVEVFLARPYTAESAGLENRDLIPNMQVGCVYWCLIT